MIRLNFRRTGMKYLLSFLRFFKSHVLGNNDGIFGIKFKSKSLGIGQKPAPPPPPPRQYGQEYTNTQGESGYGEDIEAKYGKGFAEDLLSRQQAGEKYITNQGTNVVSAAPGSKGAWDVERAANTIRARRDVVASTSRMQAGGGKNMGWMGQYAKSSPFGGLFG